MKAVADTYVTIEYEFSNPAGTVLGSSAYDGPYVFQQGSGDALPGLDKFIAGKETGDECSFVVEPEDAYGPRDEQRVFSLPRSSFSQEARVEPGTRISVNGRVATITEVQDDTVHLDANHPLAGIPLHFKIKILAISREKPEADGSCACGGSCACHE